MTSSRVFFELYCRRCDRRQTLNLEQMGRALRELGMLRRQKTPDPSVILELFHSAIEKFECPQCELPGVTVQQLEDEWQDQWEAGRPCVGCDAEIPAERLELFPDIEYCAKCQQAIERGDAVDPEYCPRCGNIMQMRSRSSGGMSRYSLYCSACRR